MYLHINRGGEIIGIKNFNVENFNVELDSRLSEIDFSEDGNVNELYEVFTSIVLNVTDKYAPQKRKTLHTQTRSLHE